MKSTLVTCLCSLALALSAFSQSPTPALEAAASPAAPAPTATAATTPAASATPDDESDLERRIERKVKRGLSITIGDDDDRKDRAGRKDRIDIDTDSSFDEGALMAIPIVGIIFSTLFGAPVLIVGLIMFFSFWKARSLHRTVRLLVEKGQPVPDALFASPPPAIRQRSDMRRGVVLVTVGIGVMLFFAAINDWEGGAWAMGIIPFLIGVGYLAVWQLEGRRMNGAKPSTDNPPPLP